MINNVSGNFATEEKEKQVVCDWLDAHGIKDYKVYKSKNYNDEDICVVLKNHLSFSIEVQEERYERYMKYHQYGIDFISRIKWKKDINRLSWINPNIHNSNEITNFIKDIDMRSDDYKPGKICYTKANMMLFFCIKDIDTKGRYIYEFNKAYNHETMVANDLVMYMLNNCQFAVNDKKRYGLTEENYDSACFFIKPEELKEYETNKPIINNLSPGIKKIINESK